MSISDTSAVNFIVWWWLFACSMNSAMSILFIVQSKNDVVYTDIVFIRAVEMRFELGFLFLPY